MSVILSGKHGVRVHSRGRMERDGALTLDQGVEEEGKPARRRTWKLVRSGNRISGSITDARGPVTGDVTGGVFHLRYRMADGPSVDESDGDVGPADDDRVPLTKLARSGKRSGKSTKASKPKAATRNSSAARNPG